MKFTRRIIYAVLSLVMVSLYATNTYAACTAIPSGSYPKTLVANTTYCLSSNVVVSNTSAFIIGGDNITFDLAGYEIRTTTANTGYGISSSTARRNITIKNGRITGFNRSISMGTSGVYNRNLIIDGITSLDSGLTELHGQGVVFRNCQIYGDAGGWQGLTVFGSGISIINNDIYNTTIYVEGQAAAGAGSFVIENNRVTNPITVQPAPGIDVNNDTMDALVINNRVSNAPTCIIKMSKIV